MARFKFRGRLSYANVMATVAVFLALGGSSYAALKITGKDVRNGSLSGRDLRDNSVRSRDVRNGSLRAQDFKAGELPGSWAVRSDVLPNFHVNQLPAVPGLAKLVFICQQDNPATGRVYVENASNAKLDSVATVTSSTDTEALRLRLDPGGSTNIAMFQGVTQVVWQIGHASDADLGTLATLTISHIADSGCHLTASATYQDATIAQDQG
jgi:hypothetical protein